MASSALTFTSGTAGGSLTGSYPNPLLPWSGIVNPTTNLSLSMASNTTAFTWGATTGSANLFTITDTASNTGTGYVLSVSTAAGSTAKPFRVVAAGTEKITVLANGNVGIGVTSPAYSLDVNGDIELTGLMRHATTGNAWFQYSAPDTRFLNLNASGNIAFRNNANNTELITITNAGNVGINDTAPAQKLTVGGHVAPTADNTYDLGTTALRWRAVHVGPGSVVVHNDATNTQKLTLDFSGANASRIASDSTSTLQVTTGANTGINLDTSGNVGIGTTSPASKFHVIFTDANTSHNSVAFPRIANSSNTAGAFIGLQFNGVTNTAVTYPAGSLTWDYTPGAGILNSNCHLRVVNVGNYLEVLTASSTGNVGINTTAPTTKFDVKGARTSGTNESLISLSDPVIGTQTVGFGTRIRGISNGTSAESAIAFEVGGTGTNNESQIAFYTQNTAAALTRRMTVDSTGNVGIGTSSPSAKLHVVGAEFRLQTDSCYYSWYNTAGTRRGYIQLVEAGDYYIVNEQNTNMLFRTNSLNRVMISNTGDVGIGTTGPTHKLHVYSTSSEEGIIVDATTYPEIRFDRSGVAKAYLAISGTAGGYAVGTLADSLIVRSENATHFITNALTLAMTINTSGTVGIGIAPDTSHSLLTYLTPQNYIGIKSGGSGTNAAVEFYDGSNYAYCGIMGASGGGAGNFAAYVGGSVRFIIDTTGRVGIGTTPVNAVRMLTISPYTGVDQYWAFNNGATEKCLIGNEESAGRRFLVYDGVAGAYRFVIDTAGRVCVGGTPGTESYLAFHVRGQQETRLQYNDSFISFFSTAGTRRGYIQMVEAGSFAFVNEQAQAIDFYTASTFRVKIGSTGGLVVGSPTGGDLGSGTINVATNIYRNNTAYTNPDYVLEKWVTGTIEKYKNNEGAKDYDGIKTLEEVEGYIRENLRLPNMRGDKPAGIFDMADMSLEKLEEIFIHLIEMNKKIKTLVSKNNLED